MFGTTTALILGSLAAGGAAGGAAIQSHAAKKAGEVQATAAENARQDTLRERERLRSDFAPYAALGSGAVNKISDVVNGISTNGRSNVLPFAPASNQPRPMSQMFAPGGGAGTPSAVPAQAPTPMQGAVPIGQSSALAAPQGMVTLRAPDGSTRQFAADQADRIIQRSNGAVTRVA